MLTDDLPSDVSEPYTEIYDLIREQNAKFDNSIVIHTFGLDVTGARLGILHQHYVQIQCCF